MPFAAYLKDLRKQLGTGSAREHAYRPALKVLLESLKNSVIATNDPRREKCGAPDFIVTQNGLTLGYVETKDIGKDLNTEEKSDQLKRYLDALPNLVLTDYLEFRWYVDGTCRRAERIGTVGRDGKIKSTKDGVGAVESLLTDFLEESGPSIDTPKDLAVRMARFAQMTRDLILATFEQEEEKGSLHGQLEDFREALIPDLTPEQFADMYAQTIAYGLFAARCHENGKGTFTREQAAFLLPKTNPFLRKLFNVIAGPDLDDRIAWMVDHLTQVLAQSQMADILKDFGKRTKQEDPVVHFYETFLKAYDPKERKIRGVYYTPEPVVSYIVRSIDYLLKSRFNRPMGLADPNTLILDPAAGTATFLYMVVNLIREALIEKGQMGAWDDYVDKHLLPRLFGFELLMAPYAVAHLKMGLLLQETGYKFRSDQRLGIYLTNSLEEGVKKTEALSFAGFISEESSAAARIKKDEPIMVVLGNPPYSVSSANTGQWIMELLEDYKRTIRQEETQIQAVSDDYVKFIRFAQWRIERTGCGLIGLISNNGYVRGLLFRDMRKALMEAFDEIYLLNLHGSTRLKEMSPEGGKDENVFDIQQGVAIILLTRSSHSRGRGQIYYADLWGTRSSKYTALANSSLDTISWTKLSPTPPFYFFMPHDSVRGGEYELGWSVLDIFGTGNRKKDQHVSYGAGFATQQDDFAISFTKDEVGRKVAILSDEKLSERDVRERFRLCTTTQWNFEEARRNLRAGKWRKNLTAVTYRAFDFRFTAYVQDIVSIPRWRIMLQLLNSDASPNVSLVTSRIINAEEPRHVFVSRRPVEKISLSAKTSNNAFVFPLYLYPIMTPSSGGQQTIPRVTTDTYVGERRPNLNPAFISEVERRIGMKFAQDGRGDLKNTFGPADVFHYVYAVLHSPTYRQRYAESLKIDFPRVPLTSNPELFRTLVQEGAELVPLHLMESPALDTLITKFPVAGSNEVEKVRYDEKQNRVYINKEQYFEGVPQEVWEFHVGGYQVCNKWLKDRKGRRLSYDDVTHYQRIVVALKRTIEVMAEIDEAIPEWPIR